MIHEVRDWWRAIRGIHSRELVRLLTAPHQALLALDAIGRALVRMISGRNLLEWNTSALVTHDAHRMRSLSAYLYAAAVASAALAAYLIVAGRVGPAALLVLGLWSLAPYAIRKLV